MPKKTECKGYNRVTGKPCESWATVQGYCRPHALRAGLLPMPKGT
jgi:hypothetical protein